MKHRKGGVIDTGNLEFISFGKVRVNKDFTGHITTTKTMRGEVTFVKAPDIYENVIVARETVDTLGQRQARLQQDMIAVPMRVQQQVDRENLRLRQAQNALARIQAENPQQLADAQQRLNAARAGAV